MKPIPQSRFAIAMGMYAVLAILAGVQLDGKMQAVVWIFLAGLAAKTWIAKLRQDHENKEH